MKVLKLMGVKLCIDDLERATLAWRWLYHFLTRHAILTVPATPDN
jgi:hypothetical protein